MLPILRRPPEMCGTYSFLFVRIETLLVSCRSPRSFLTSINFTSSPHLKLISPRSTRRVQPPCAGRRTRIILNAFMESKRRSESCKSELRKSEERNSGRNSTYSHILPWNLFDSSLWWCDRMGIHGIVLWSRSLWCQKFVGKTTRRCSKQYTVGY